MKKNKESDFLGDEITPEIDENPHAFNEGFKEVYNPITFWDYESKPTLRGVYLGHGKTIKKTDTHVIKETDSGDIYFVPQWKLLEGLNELKAGECEVILTHKGVKKTDNGTVHVVGSQQRKLPEPLKDGTDYDSSTFLD